MIRPNPRLKIDVAEQRPRSLVRSAHHQPRSLSEISESFSSIDYDDFFNSLLERNGS